VAKIFDLLNVKLSLMMMMMMMTKIII